MTISNDEIERLYKLALEHTPNLDSSILTKVGFFVGFRCYERMAERLGREIANSESALFSHKDEP